MLGAQAVERDGADGVRDAVPFAGRYHSTSELTRPNSSRAVTFGSTSGRMSPAASASRTSPATYRSNWRRRARATRSTSVLPRIRSSSVT